MKTHRPTPAAWRLGSIAAAIGLSVILILVIAPILVYPPLSGSQLTTVSDPQRRIELQQAQANLQNQVRTTLLQALAGLVVVAGAIATWRQVHVSHDANITTQFSRAVDQLGSDNCDVRIGGIYALERIARTSPHDRVTIMFMLGAFIRRHAPWPTDTTSHPTADIDEHLPWLRVRQPDVQAAMNALSRRLVDPYAARLYLARTDLRSVQINDGGQFTNANFNHANLARAWLRGVTLDRSGFKNCDLRHANLAQASLISADLRHAHLQHANLRNATLNAFDITFDGRVTAGRR